jgi:hypothetical protein
MNDVNLRLPDIIREMKLAEDASKMIEPSVDGILTKRHFRSQCCEQRAFGSEAGDLHIELGSIQPVCDMNELALGAADTEVAQKLQKSYSLRETA